MQFLAQVNEKPGAVQSVELENAMPVQHAPLVRVRVRVRVLGFGLGLGLGLVLGLG